MWMEAARGGVQRERGTQNTRRRAPKATAKQGLFCGWDEIFLKSFQFRLVTGYFFFSQPHSVGNPCELPGKGEKKKKSFLKREKKKKKTRHEISSTSLIPCPHLPAFRTHTPPCSMCDHPCRWTEPSRMCNMASGQHKHTRICTPLPSAQYTHTDFTVMSKAV